MAATLLHRQANGSGASPAATGFSPRWRQLASRSASLSISRAKKCARKRCAPRPCTRLCSREYQLASCCSAFEMGDQVVVVAHQRVGNEAELEPLENELETLQEGRPLDVIVQ